MERNLKLPHILVPERIEKFFETKPPLPEAPNKPTIPTPLVEKYESEGSGTFFGVLFLLLGVIPLLLETKVNAFYFIITLGIAATIFYFKFKFKSDFYNNLPKERINYKNAVLKYNNDLKVYNNSISKNNELIKQNNTRENIERFHGKLLKEKLTFKDRIYPNDGKELQKNYPSLANVLAEKQFLYKTTFLSKEFLVAKKNASKIAIEIKIVKPRFLKYNNKADYYFWGSTQNFISIYFTEEQVLFYPEKVVEFIEETLNDLDKGIYPNGANNLLTYSTNLSREYVNYLLETKDDDYLIAIGKKERPQKFTETFEPEDDDLPF